ncbi:arsenic resistance protein [Gordonia sp. TBRC 11910]|uniref:Arsenic resistance protein n=2 Tax=Gordonia asplenii TaxID=2725283 RepID=A0A848KWV5_9ACTN|nr:arsenic resistance protein [Gordonia asplenii]
MERRQVPLYLVAIGAGGIVGITLPDAAPTLAHAINPTLAALLYVTFLQVPAAALLTAIKNGRFIAILLALNFLIVPLVVAVLAEFLPSDQSVRIGALLVLLCPCIDYVVVFSGLAGADSRRLLAATPVLLIAQTALLPLYLYFFLGSDLAAIVDVGPFVEAFAVLIVLPLVLAWATQWWSAAHRSGTHFVGAAGTSMVPLMMVVLAVVVACQLPRIGSSWSTVLAVAPVYVCFLVVMPVLGDLISRRAGFDAAARRAVVFSGATRNSLVVLPLALSLPPGFDLAGAVVVTQTLVEVIGMVVYVRVIPKVIV